MEKDHESTTVWNESQDWEKLYGYINVANLILSLIDDQEAVSSHDREEVNRIKGESYFLRGAYYFTLANLYGKPYSLKSASTDLAVPLKLNEVIEDKIYERASVQEVYEQVLADLLTAEKLLKEIPKKSVVRASHTAVCLLLSRVYLYMQSYKEAMMWAEECLKGQSNLIDLNGFSGSDFLYRDSPELIFTMGSNCLPMNFSTYAEGFCVSEELYNCFEEEDLRNRYFVTAEDGIYKYKKAGSNYNRIDVSDNFAFRTAEAYLNLAEAAACLGGEHTVRAQQAYNTLRENRIAGNAFQKEESLSNRELVDAIRLERRRELCLEGHRWFDLRRYMVNDLYPSEKTLTNEYVVYKYKYNYVSYSYELVLYRRYTLPPHDGAWTLPIPSEELNANYGMPDNERTVRAYESLI